MVQDLHECGHKTLAEICQCLKCITLIAKRSNEDQRKTYYGTAITNEESVKHISPWLKLCKFIKKYLTNKPK